MEVGLIGKNTDPAGEVKSTPKVSAALRRRRVYPHESYWPSYKEWAGQGGAGQVSLRPLDLCPGQPAVLPGK